MNKIFDRIGNIIDNIGCLKNCLQITVYLNK
jgi:hypothetical protein